jgi:tRNA/tmRNA/rRNA uracil-C5-methylase (TrmA/RlmC/RlmD family)
MEDEINNIIIVKKQLKKILAQNKKLKYRNKLECEVNMELARRLDNMKSTNRKIVDSLEVMQEKMNEQLLSSTELINEIKNKINNKLSLNSSKLTSL